MKYSIEGAIVHGEFIVSLIALCLGYYFAERGLREHYFSRFDRRPEFLREGYLFSLAVTVFWFLLIPVIRFHAAAEGVPWYGHTATLVITGLVIFVCGVIASYLYYRDR